MESQRFEEKMSARNRGPPMPMKGMPHGVPLPSVHESHLGNGLRPLPPHPALLEEMRDPPFGMDPRRLPPHPLIIEERLASQHEEIQALLADNQRLAATHVALKQELEAAHHELQSKRQYADALHAEKDVHIRELHDKAMRLEVDLRGLEVMRNELLHVRTDIKDLSAAREELGNQVQVMTRDLGRYNADMQRIPALKTDIDTTKQELQRARAAIECEKKGYAKNYEHGRVMEKKLVEMARELEKLRAEIATAEMRASAASAVNNPGAVYNSNYVNPEVAYGNPYYGYGMNPVQAQATTDSYPQYGHAPGSWGAYDMQQAQGHR